MYALIAALVAIAVIAMMWRFLERETAASDDERSDTPRPPRPTLPARPRRTPKSRMVAPDDDPDFLRELGKRINKNPNDEHRPDST